MQSDITNTKTTKFWPGRFYDALRPRLSRFVAGAIFTLGVYWAAVAAWRSTFAIFGRDQGIFQYVAWALGSGDRVYVDFREINGPLIHILHLGFQRLGGTDEHVFRLLDIALSSSVFLLVGALLPGIARRKGSTLAPPPWTERALWALATWVVLMSQYVAYGWWQTAQRESFYDLFLLASLVLQLHAQRPQVGERERFARLWLFAIAGALGALTWFGKPTCLLYTAVQGVVLLIDKEAPLSRKKGLLALAAGCAVASLAMIGFIAVTGDLASYLRIVFSEVPKLYRHIWSRSLGECYEIYGNAPQLNYAFATLIPGLALVALGVLPRRFLLVLSLLACGLFVFFFQGKGFPYHLHPVTAGTHLVWLTVAAWVAERATATPRKPVAAFGLAALALGVVLGARAFIEASRSEAAQNRWDQTGRTADARASEAHVRQFPWGDFFAWDIRQAASFLRANTEPADRVQTYGMDPYLLFLAERKSASPYIYSFELNVDAALEGGSGGHPGEADRTWLRETSARNDRMILAALERAPPAAFALFDLAPFSYAPDGLVDFDQHCPESAAFMHARYEPAARFGAVHVWLRRDVLERRAAP